MKEGLAEVVPAEAVVAEAVTAVAAATDRPWFVYRAAAPEEVINEHKLQEAGNGGMRNNRNADCGRICSSVYGAGTFPEHLPYGAKGNPRALRGRTE